MILLDNTAGAFLRRGSDYLLMKRSEHKKSHPGIWSNVGGHIEQYELNDPYSACIREIYEETGISEEHIFNLTLRYIIIRRAGDIIRQSYVYFGETDVTEVQQSDEGVLYWIPENELTNRQFSPTFNHMLNHFLTNTGKGIVVGTAKNNGGLQMSWALVEDFE